MSYCEDYPCCGHDQNECPPRREESYAGKELPESIKSDSRICFGIEYFATEEDAKVYAKHVRERGDTYNGGYFHGMQCGRETRFDHVDTETGQQLYAVTTI